MSEKLVQEIIKKSLRTVSKKKFKDKEQFLNAVNNFVSSIRSNLVKLKLIDYYFSNDKSKQPYQHWNLKFEIIFDLNDAYIDSKIYQAGSVYIFPSKKIYADIQKKSLSLFESYPIWNTENTIATISGKARDY
ncbi:MAG: hypothetical protein PHF86_07440 [Candidatus Nanoarchaeia archaeon]|jgi:hypothetical protein|nr:hypothetical protein [Candidatus Nanoarchaeia archaeon]